MWYSRQRLINIVALLTVTALSVYCGKQSDDGKPRKPGASDPQPTAFEIDGKWKGTLSTGSGTPKVESRRIEIRFEEFEDSGKGRYIMEIAATPLSLDVADGYTVSGTFTSTEADGRRTISMTPEETNYGLFAANQTRSLDMEATEGRLFLSDEDTLFDLVRPETDKVTPKPRPTGFDGSWKCTSLRTSHALILKISNLGTFRMRIEQPGQEEVQGEGESKPEPGKNPKIAKLKVTKCDRKDVEGQIMTANLQSKVFMTLTSKLSALTGNNNDSLDVKLHCQPQN